MSSHWFPFGAVPVAESSKANSLPEDSARFRTAEVTAFTDAPTAKSVGPLIKLMGAGSKGLVPTALCNVVGTLPSLLTDIVKVKVSMMLWLP